MSIVFAAGISADTKPRKTDESPTGSAGTMRGHSGDMRLRRKAIHEPSVKPQSIAPGHALPVGETTFGKGSVQEVIPLPEAMINYPSSVELRLRKTAFGSQGGFARRRTAFSSNAVVAYVRS